MAKLTKIKLVVNINGKESNTSFPVHQAKRILGMKKNGGWKLPDDSKYEYTDGDIKLKPKNKK